MPSSEASDQISLTLEQGVAIATLERVSRANSFDWDMMAELDRILTRVHWDQEIRGLILTGRGDRFFCAGADMKLVSQMEQHEYARFLEIGLGMIEKIQRCPKPTIAAINGLSIGGGGEVALACDFMVAAQGCRISFPELSLGMVPGWGAAFRLARLVGQARAMEILLTGRVMSAEEARDCGLVNRVAPGPELLDEARALMAQVLLNSPLAISLTKRIIRAEREMSTLGGESLEALASLTTFMSQDGKAGINAISTKKKPTWSGK